MSPLTRSRIARALWLGLMLLCYTACSKGAAVSGEFWVKGLTLPPGSVVIQRYEMDDLGEQEGMTYVPTKGKPDKMLAISFDNPGNWDKVESHIDSCMRELGYKELMDDIKEMSKNMPGGSGLIDEELTSGMCMYLKPGTKFSVSLIDNSDFAGVRAPEELKQMGMAKYELHIMTFK